MATERRLGAPLRSMVLIIAMFSNAIVNSSALFSVVKVVAKRFE